MILAVWRMHDSQGALFNAWTVNERYIWVFIVARLAHAMGTKTEEGGHFATIHTFPRYLISSMLLTLVYTDSCHFYEAALTEQILFLRFLLLSICSLLLAVNEAAEVRILTVVTQVKGAPMVCIFLRFSVEMVIWSR